MVQARVREWHDEDAWGVIDSAETPGGCWVHLVHVDVEGASGLRDGDLVELSYEPADQDGFSFRATRVTIPGTPPRQHGPETTPGSAYRSSLVIEWDDEDRPNG